MTLNDLENNKGEKIVLDSGFIYTDDDIRFKFIIEYDCGKGFKSPTIDRETLNFAEKIKDHVEKLGNLDKKLFYVDTDNQYIMGSKEIQEVEDNAKRYLFLKNLYAFGLEVDVPVFMQLGEEYLYINELKFEPKGKDEREATLNKYKEIDQFIQKHMYGEGYQRFKIEKEMHRLI